MLLPDLFFVFCFRLQVVSAKAYHMFGPRMKLKKSFRHLTDASLIFTRDQKVHNFGGIFDPPHLFVAVVLNCRTLSKI